MITLETNTRRQFCNELRKRLEQLTRKQDDLAKKLKHHFYEETYRALNIVNQRIDCLEARMAGEWFNDAVEPAHITPKQVIFKNQ